MHCRIQRWWISRCFSSDLALLGTGCETSLEITGTLHAFEAECVLHVCAIWNKIWLLSGENQSDDAAILAQDVRLECCFADGGVSSPRPVTIYLPARVRFSNIERAGARAVHVDAPHLLEYLDKAVCSCIASNLWDAFDPQRLCACSAALGQLDVESTARLVVARTLFGKRLGWVLMEILEIGTVQSCR